MANLGSSLVLGQAVDCQCSAHRAKAIRAGKLTCPGWPASSLFHGVSERHWTDRTWRRHANDSLFSHGTGRGRWLSQAGREGVWEGECHEKAVCGLQTRGARLNSGCRWWSRPAHAAFTEHSPLFLARRTRREMRCTASYPTARLPAWLRRTCSSARLADYASARRVRSGSRRETAGRRGGIASGHVRLGHRHQHITRRVPITEGQATRFVAVDTAIGKASGRSLLRWVLAVTKRMRQGTPACADDNT